MKPSQPAGPELAISKAQQALLNTVSGIDARDYADALHGLFRQTAMFAPVTDQVQTWLINADALAGCIDALIREQEQILTT